MTPALTVVISVAIAAALRTIESGQRLADRLRQAWHAIVALDISRSGDLLYTEDGEITTASVKPPLYFWAMALSFQTIGPSEFAAPSSSRRLLCVDGRDRRLFVQRHLHWTVALTVAILLSTQQRLVYHHDAPLGASIHP